MVEAVSGEFSIELILKVSDEVFDNLNGLCERGLYLEEFGMLFVSLIGGSFEFFSVFFMSNFQISESVSGFIEADLA